MNTMTIYILAWLGMVVLAIGNGVLREKLYTQYLSELAAHQVSTLTAIVLFGIYIYVLTGVFQIQSAHQAIMIGSVWLLMTIVFEFVFGHYVAGHAWPKLLLDYNLRRGRVWILVLIWVLIAPYIAFHIRA